MYDIKPATTTIDTVKDYYGRVLKSSADLATACSVHCPTLCCSDRQPPPPDIGAPDVSSIFSERAAAGTPPAGGYAQSWTF